MLSRKHSSYKKTVQSSRTELEKLEKTHKSELRMMLTAASKFRSKFFRVEDPKRWQAETEACNVRMYETHFPGFCYEKDGKYKKRFVNVLQPKTTDPAESSDKVKALLFTDDELDIRKVICLHLLETHIQSRRHISRRDGKPVYFVKSSTHRNKHAIQLSQQAITQKGNANEKSVPSIYDKLLPRYVLDVQVTNHMVSALSLNSSDNDTSSEDGSLRRRHQIPLYSNTDIRTITSSVLEALEAVNSPKLKEIISICRNPEQIKSLLAQEEVLEFLIELIGNQLIGRPIAYEYTMAHALFEKDAETETLAQVLEFPTDPHVRNMLNQIRKNLGRKYDELRFSCFMPRRNKTFEGSRQIIAWDVSKTSFASSRSNLKNSSTAFANGFGPMSSRLRKFSLTQSDKFWEKDELSADNCLMPTLKEASSEKPTSQSMRSLIWPRKKSATTKAVNEEFENDEKSMTFLQKPVSRNASGMKESTGSPDSDSRYDLKSLNNSQRILLGLKVASLKSRPVNMHQFENNKKIDVVSLISSIVHPLTLDSRANEMNPDDNYFFQDKRRTKRSISRIGMNQFNSLGNLNRDMLSNFRHDIATTENKKRVKQFLKSDV
ncbi:UNVERIFIED_CONTAM: hypothetical protein PYX00_003201 [Menopon gallinae]|uniref:Uncharacterized protein n=1 Tax=Menopon gallinae TaxID=328185 RepID=A0AAW2HZK0_9NEOP